MEHLFHIFGGGCGEHLILPGLLSLLSSVWVFLRFKFSMKQEDREGDSGE